MVPPRAYLVLSAVLFMLGAVGVLLRRNALIIFMAVELMLNSVNLAFVTFARLHWAIEGQVTVFFVLVVAAVEVVVGLALIVDIFGRGTPWTSTTWICCGGSDDPMLCAVDAALAAVGWLTNGLIGRRLSRACSPAPGGRPAVGASFVDGAASSSPRIGETRAPEGACRSGVPLYSWLGAGDLDVQAGLLVDALSLVMVLTVSGVGLLIHVYSIGYMAEDPDASRYFAYLNLFMFAMLLLVLAGNLLVLFVGWELVGLCSYLLIGFWFARPAAATAGRKAFIVNRIGDAAFLLGLLHPVHPLGTLDILQIRDGAADLSGGAAHPRGPAPVCRAPRGSRRNSRCTSGCPTRWKGRRPSPR